MKTFQYSLAVAFASVGLMMSCNDNAPVPDDTVRPVQISADISARTTSFAFDFLHNLQATVPAGDNVFVSPLSLHIALGMLVNGAENETAAEILKALQMQGVSQEDLNKAYNTLINDLPVADSRISLGIANSVWYRSDFSVESSFKDVLAKSFNAEVSGLPFNDAAKNKINQWASDKTNGKIPQVIDQIKPEHVMFLLNALYFKGDWKTKFDAKHTDDTEFTLENGSKKLVKMMYSKSKYKVSSLAEYGAIQLPYGNGQFTMTLLLPKGANTIDKIFSNLDGTAWNTLTSNFGEQTVKVGLPRFTLKYSAKLDQALDKMGIRKVYTSQAELGKISKSGQLFVDFVKQDTYLNVDEKGSKAAAVTSIGVGVTSAGPEEPTFICDRPFGIVISENTSKTILFMGRIKNPESK